LLIFLNIPIIARADMLPHVSIKTSIIFPLRPFENSCINSSVTAIEMQNINDRLIINFISNFKFIKEEKHNIIKTKYDIKCAVFLTSNDILFCIYIMSVSIIFVIIFDKKIVITLLSEVDFIAFKLEL
jgi:hypothetical protein